MHEIASSENGRKVYRFYIVVFAVSEVILDRPVAKLTSREHPEPEKHLCGKRR